MLFYRSLLKIDTPCPQLIDHKTQQAQETRVKLGVPKVQRMEQPITHKVSKALTPDVFYHCDQLPNRASALPVYIKIVVQSLV